MDQFDPKIDAAFFEYTDLELRCHRLISEGKDDSAEIADAEDRMERLWAKLDDVQKRSLRGMASDLAWVRVKGTPAPKGRKTPDEISRAERQELATARGRKDWHRLLHFLRLCAPDFSIATLARERGLAYRAIGLPEYANIFDAQATELAGAMPTSGELPMSPGRWPSEH
jgi:hypothetical protein